MDAKSTPVAAAAGLPTPITPSHQLPLDHEEPELTVWERLQDRVHENQAVINTFIAGGLAGAASRTVVSPLERLKIILQVQSSKPGGAGEAYDGVWKSLVRMWKDEGFKGFMKGNGINVIRVSRSCERRRRRRVPGELGALGRGEQVPSGGAGVAVDSYDALWLGLTGCRRAQDWVSRWIAMSETAGPTLFRQLRSCCPDFEY